MKIKFKLSIIVIAIMIIVVTTFALILVSQASAISRSLSIRSIKNLTGRRVEAQKGIQDGYILTIRTMAESLSRYETIPLDIRRDLIDSILSGPVELNDDIFQLYAIFKPNALDGMDSSYIGRTGSTATGQYAMVWTKETGRMEARASADVADTMAYLNGPNAGRDRVTDPFIRAVAGKDTLMYRIMTPIRNPSTGEIIGAVGVIVDISYLQPSLLTTIENNEEIAVMALYARNGLVLANIFPDRLGKIMREAERVEYAAMLDTAVKVVEDGDTTQFYLEVPTLNAKFEVQLQSFAIGNSGYTWTLMIGSASEYILAEVNQIIRFSIILASIFIVVTAAILFFIFNGVTMPILKVAETLKDIAQGEGDLTKRIIVKSKDETGDLANYFNQTLEKIKNLVITIKQQAAALFDIGNELSSNMTETASAINEITANTQSIKGRVLNQSASVTETNATMEQITLQIEKVNGYVENQAASVAESSSAIEEMLANIRSVTQTLVNNAQNVKELSSASELGRSGLQEVASDIQEIARESEGLLEINSVMENIASQTNLLSMNAAIEAAHAGEAGKGFAVVADEIRKLAENSSEQSKTISTVLKKIKSSIVKITVSTDNVLKRFEAIDSSVKVVSEQEEIIRNAMEEQGEGSKQVLEAISQLNDLTQRVKNGSMTMQEGSKEVIHEGSNLEKVTQEITGGMNEMASGAEQINTAVNELNEISLKNKQNIDLLAREVSKFKVE